MASCIPVLQRPLSREIKGRSDTGPKLHGQFCPWWLGRDQETSRSWKGVSQRAQLPARAHWPAAGQSQVPSPVPCQSSGLLHLGLHCKEMALSTETPCGQQLEKALGTSAVLARWHQALGLGEPAGTPGWGISASTGQKMGNPLDQGSQCRHRKCVVLLGCSQDPTLQQRRWVWGRLALLPPRTPWSPVQQGSWLQTGWQWHCGRTGAWHWPG